MLSRIAIRRVVATPGSRALSLTSVPDTANGIPISVYNPTGKKRVVVTKPLPGDRWLEILTSAGIRVEVCALDAPEDTILSTEKIKTLIGSKCDGAIGQLTESWGDELFAALKSAGGTAYSNYAVGFNNVDVGAATSHGIPVGNTPGVLTETTAEIGAALTLAAARRIVEADAFMRNGKFLGWLPSLFVGQLLQGGTVGIIGAGRIGQAYARMMIEGHKMSCVYFDLSPQPEFEAYVNDYSDFLTVRGEAPLTCTRVSTIEELLPLCDVVSIHTALTEETKHTINAERLKLMKPASVLVNTARGPHVNEADLVAHLKSNPTFVAGLDVFEEEPIMAPGLAECDNAVIVPHIASASLFTRGGMATLAAANVASLLQGYPIWTNPSDVKPFLDGPVIEIPKMCPSIVNAEQVGLK